MPFISESAITIFHTNKTSIILPLYALTYPQIITNINNLNEREVITTDICVWTLRLSKKFKHRNYIQTLKVDPNLRWYESV